MLGLRLPGALISLTQKKSGLVVVFKLMPESPETDLEAMKEEVRKTVQDPAELQGFQIEPVAFGLKALKVTVLMDDIEGGPDMLEEAFGNIDSVESVQVVDLGRFG